MGTRGWNPLFVNLSAHMYVESRQRTERQGYQVFVAMWFDSSLVTAFIQGFKPRYRSDGLRTLPSRLGSFSGQGR